LILGEAADFEGLPIGFFIFLNCLIALMSRSGILIRPHMDKINLAGFRCNDKGFRGFSVPRLGCLPPR